MELKVELVQIGELDLDDVRVNGKRAGLCPHQEGAVLRFVRLPSPEEAEAVRAEVARIRHEAGRPPISDQTMQPPNPNQIRSYERKRKATK